MGSNSVIAVCISSGVGIFTAAAAAGFTAVGGGVL